MRVCVIKAVAVLTQDLSSQRLRVLNGPLRELGFDLRSRGVPWLRTGPLREADVVLLHRALPGRFAYRRIRRAASRLVFDIDRAPFLRRTRRGVETSRVALARFARIAASADLVTASNPYLAAHARRFTDEWRVKLLPEAVELGLWARRERALDRAGRIVLGWMGSPASFPDLTALSGALRRLCELFPGLELRVVSDVPPRLDGVRTTFARREPDQEAKEIDAFDIALALYAEDAVSMGETPREVLAYLASGVPMVAADSLSLRPMLKDRRNCLLAQSPEEWERKIGLLIEAPDLGRQLGRGARETAEKIYAADRIARGLASILESLGRIPARRSAGP